jgi:cyclophilin family peptidyl-prolyl cis-trans isomerase
MRGRRPETGWEASRTLVAALACCCLCWGVFFMLRASPNAGAGEGGLASNGTEAEGSETEQKGSRVKGWGDAFLELPDVSTKPKDYYAKVSMQFMADGGMDGSVDLGNVELGLFKDTPLTSENFRVLCTGEKGSDLHLKGAMMHRVIPNFMAQGGLRSGKSLFGGAFPDENFIHQHHRHVLSMANSGPNTGASQFFITFEKQPHLNGKHVVFGEVLSGKPTLDRIMSLGSPGGPTKSPIKIVDCTDITEK